MRDSAAFKQTVGGLDALKGKAISVKKTLLLKNAKNGFRSQDGLMLYQPAGGASLIKSKDILRRSQSKDWERRNQQLLSIKSTK